MEKRFWPAVIVGFTGYFAMMAGGIWLLGLLAAVVFFVSKEYTKILTNKGFFPSRRVIFVTSMLLLAIAYFDRQDLVPLAMTICTMAAFMCVLFRGKQPYIANVATNMLGMIYCGWFPVHIIYIRNMGFEGNTLIPHPTGAGYCFILLVAVLLCDSFCYFVGSRFGKHKLSKVISPNKTIEGAIGGTVVSVVFTVLTGLLLGLSWYNGVVLGLLIAIFAQIGDLCESMIKRDAGVKDSSDIIPGHGGFLDRCDSYILTIPIVYYFLEYCVNQQDLIGNIFMFVKGLF